MVTHDEDLANQVTRKVTIADGNIVDDVNLRRAGDSRPIEAYAPAAVETGAAANGASDSQTEEPAPVEFVVATSSEGNDD